MEFWGVEVKSNQPLRCDPGDDKYLHLSQASLGETKKDKSAENVTIFLKFDDHKLVLGTLSGEKCPQISYDLVFEKEFELSHNSKNASVYFLGYTTTTMDDTHSEFSDSEDESDDEPIPLLKPNGKSDKDELAKPATGKATTAKADGSSAKPKAEESKQADKPKLVEDEDEDEDEDGDEDEEDESDDEEMAEGAESDDEDEEDDSDEEDEATPKKVEVGKKRAAGSASKTPVPEKKAKLVSPAGSQKTGGDAKKGGHTATPHPVKQAGKTSANIDKSKQQTPKSAGSIACKSCSKTFNSENALQAHTKAKHGAAK